jgi:hypothetical protein
MGFRGSLPRSLTLNDPLDNDQGVTGGVSFVVSFVQLPVVLAVSSYDSDAQNTA